MTNRRRPWQLTALENRLTPAVSLRYLSGHLTLTGDDTGNAITLNRTATAVTVKAGGIDFGSYVVTGNVTVHSGNGNDTVSLVFASATALPGLFEVSAGLGNDTIFVNKADSTATGTISGRARFELSTGNDSVQVGSKNAVEFAGDVFINGGTGTDTVAFIADAGKAVEVNGQLLVTSVSNFKLDSLDGATKVGVAGNVVLNNTNDGSQPTTVDWDDVNVGGSAVLLTADGDDLITFDDLTVAGDVTAVVRGGSATVGNEFEFDPGSAVININGSLTYLGGNGKDTVDLDATSAATFIGGSVLLNMGDGPSAYDLFEAAAGVPVLTVNGDFTLISGNGDDAVGDFDPAVGGNVTLNLGGGSNNFVFRGDSAGSIGGTLLYNGGSGKDTVTIKGANSFTLRAYLGAGADSFTYAGGSRVGQATIDFGVDFDLFDVYTQTAGVLVDWQQLILNLDPVGVI